MTAPKTADQDWLARRNALLLALAVGIGGGNASINIALGGILGAMLAPGGGLATLPVTAFVVGAFLTSMPASLLMAKVGRKPGFLLGGAIGAAGGGLAAAAILVQSFALFVAASALCGSYHGFNQLYRFAASDSASPAFRPKAVSWVMVGGLLSAFIGPQLVILTRDLVPTALYAGPYLAAAAIIALAMIPVTLCRFQPPAGQSAGEAPARPLREIARQPLFIAAVIVGMVAYALMNLVMTASPLAMLACGHDVRDAALGIQWHIVAMFAPSFFTGALIARFGGARVMAAGLVLLAASGAIALSGITVPHFWAALVLLGLGWNFAYVAATTAVTQCHRPSERGKVQGLNDSLVFGLVALASLTAGWLQEHQGWGAVNLVVFPAVALGLAILAVFTFRARTAKITAK